MFRVTPYDRTHLAGLLALCAAEGWLLFASDAERAHRVLTAPGVTTAVAIGGGAGPGGGTGSGAGAAGGAASRVEVLGFAQLLSDGEIQAYLANLLVAPSRRGEGIARSLLENVHRRAGGERISLLSEEGATGFYAMLTHQRRPGFRIYPPFTRASPAAQAPGAEPPAH